MFTEPQQTCATLWSQSVSNNFHKQTRSFARNSSKWKSSDLTSQYHNSTASRWFSLVLVKCSKWCSHANTCIFVGQQLYNYMEFSVRSRVRWPKSWVASNFYWDVIWCNVPFVGGLSSMPVLQWFRFCGPSWILYIVDDCPRFFYSWNIISLVAPEKLRTFDTAIIVFPTWFYHKNNYAVKLC